MEDIVRIACFDIGKINFCFYIEEVNISSLKQVKNIIKTERYNIDGTITSKFSEILDKVYQSGTKVLLENHNITGDTDTDKYFDFNLCYNMAELLDEYQEYWDSVDYIIVERQMSFRKKYNTMALKLAQHCESYFINKYGRSKTIIEFDAFHKTQVLGAKKDKKETKTGKVTYKNIGDRERKKWTIEQAFYILSQRNDYDTMSEIGLMKKRDDVSDNICMAQAFKYLYFICKQEL